MRFFRKLKQRCTRSSASCRSEANATHEFQPAGTLRLHEAAVSSACICSSAARLSDANAVHEFAARRQLAMHQVQQRTRYALSLSLRVYFRLESGPPALICVSQLSEDHELQAAANLLERLLPLRTPSPPTSSSRPRACGCIMCSSPLRALSRSACASRCSCRHRRPRVPACWRACGSRRKLTQR